MCATLSGLNKLYKSYLSGELFDVNRRGSRGGLGGGEDSTARGNMPTPVSVQNHLAAGRCAIMFKGNQLWEHNSILPLVFLFRHICGTDDLV